MVSFDGEHDFLGCRRRRPRLGLVGVRARRDCALLERDEPIVRRPGFLLQNLHGPGLALSAGGTLSALAGDRDAVARGLRVLAAVPYDATDVHTAERPA